jgi:hypothetical protein
MHFFKDKNFNFLFSIKKFVAGIMILIIILSLVILMFDRISWSQSDENSQTNYHLLQENALNLIDNIVFTRKPIDTHETLIKNIEIFEGSYLNYQKAYTKNKINENDQYNEFLEELNVFAKEDLLIKKEIAKITELFFEIYIKLYSDNLLSIDFTQYKEKYSIQFLEIEKLNFTNTLLQNNFDYNYELLFNINEALTDLSTIQKREIAESTKLDLLKDRIFQLKLDFENYAGLLNSNTNDILEKIEKIREKLIVEYQKIAN